ncbi:hypothetical protein AMJ85_11510 [candidate division BRC1 bacterium SM23_51]|nr:MAG: hypothetical protein AMJ85_11510 [candidate division BRC1 bacterium SM23_51]
MWGLRGILCALSVTEYFDEPMSLEDLRSSQTAHGSERRQQRAFPREESRTCINSGIDPNQLHVFERYTWQKSED